MRLIVEKWILAELYAQKQEEGDNKNDEQQVFKLEEKQLTTQYDISWCKQQEKSNTTTTTTTATSSTINTSQQQQHKRNSQYQRSAITNNVRKQEEEYKDQLLEEDEDDDDDEEYLERYNKEQQKKYEYNTINDSLLINKYQQNSSKSNKNNQILNRGGSTTNKRNYSTPNNNNTAKENIKYMMMMDSSNHNDEILMPQMYQSSILSASPSYNNNDLSWNNLKNVYRNNSSSYPVARNLIQDDHDENRVNSLVNEFVKLNEYLMSECKLFEELESNLYFSSEQKIIDFINNDLKARLLKLSQSSKLFERTKCNFQELTPNQDAILYLERLEEKYLDLFEILKSKIKCKKTRLEKYLQNWYNFNQHCAHLDILLSADDELVENSLSYREKLIAITEQINNLKKEFSNLTTVIDETTYMKLENTIIIYELKLKKFKEEYGSLKSRLVTTDYQQTEFNSAAAAVDHSRLPPLPPSSYNKVQTKQKRQQPQFITNTKTNLLSLDLGNSDNSDDNSNEARFSSTKYKDDSLSSKKQNRQYAGDNNRSSRIMTSENDDNNNYYYYDAPTASNVKYAPAARQYPKEISQIEDYPQQQKKPEMCDKCVETVNEIGTQTVDDHDLEHLYYLHKTFSSTSLEHQHQKQNVNLIHRKKSNNSNNASNGANKLLRNRANRNSNNNLNSSSAENCGKKLLLEAYLKNNNNNNNPNETTTSENETYASEGGHVFRTETTTTTTRESGIGTFNDDEIDEDAYNSKSMLPLSSTNFAPATATAPKRLFDPNNNEVVFDKSPSSSIIQPPFALASPQQKAIKPKMQQKSKVATPAAAAESTHSAANSYLKKLLKYLLLFSIFFLLLIFFVYRFFFHPVCCDFKRDYLFINYISN